MDFTHSRTKSTRSILPSSWAWVRKRTRRVGSFGLASKNSPCLWGFPSSIFCHAFCSLSADPRSTLPRRRRRWIGDRSEPFDRPTCEEKCDQGHGLRVRRESRRLGAHALLGEVLRDRDVVHPFRHRSRFPDSVVVRVPRISFPTFFVFCVCVGV